MKLIGRYIKKAWSLAMDKLQKVAASILLPGGHF